jgi:hypothetical protein
MAASSSGGNLSPICGARRPRLFQAAATAAAAPPAAKVLTLKEKPVLRLAFRRPCG